MAWVEWKGERAGRDGGSHEGVEGLGGLDYGVECGSALDQVRRLGWIRLSEVRWVGSVSSRLESVGFAFSRYCLGSTGRGSIGFGSRRFWLLTLLFRGFACVESRLHSFEALRVGTCWFLGLLELD